MTARRISRIAILAALCIVLRVAFGPFPNIKPITAFFLISLFYMSAVDAFLIMGVTIFGSGLIFGFSIVVLWQILSFFVIMSIWRLLFVPFVGTGRFWLLIQSFFATLITLSYGFWISIPLSFQFSTNLFVFWVNGLSFDLLHAVSTGLFYPLIDSIFRRFYPHEKIIFRP
ncbi:hypothetical protein ACVR1I_02625 [Streptococcus cameli]